MLALNNDEASEHDKDLGAFHRSPSRPVARIVNSKIIRWAEHIDGMGIQGIHTQFWWANLLGRVHLENHGERKMK
jgi:hypothetical protein